MPIPRNYDNTLIGQYIRAIENADSVGFDHSTHRWYAPKGAQFDSNNRGMGVDVHWNDDAKALSRGREGRWLTEQEERDIRNSFINDAQRFINEQAPAGSLAYMMSPEMRAMATGLYYRGEKKYLNNNNNPLGKAFKENDEKAFNKALQEHYRKRGVSDRAEKDAAFWRKRREAQQKERQNAGSGWLSSDPKERLQATNNYLNRWNVGNKHSEGGNLQKEENMINDRMPLWDGLTLREKQAYIRTAVRNGVRNMPDIRRAYNEFAQGADTDKTNIQSTNQFKKGGFMPSKRMQQQIAKWEGNAMTQATIDPLSGKRVAKNRSFEEVAQGFVNALPTEIRSKVLSNPDLADYLYSYAYNVGVGNFRKRAIPALQRYYSGQGSVSDIQNSMWATGDKKLKGLARRRAWERKGVGMALQGNQPQSDIVYEAPSSHILPTESTVAYTTPAPLHSTPIFQPLNESAVIGADVAQFPASDNRVITAPVVEDTPQTPQPIVEEAEQEKENQYQGIQALMAVQDVLNSQDREYQLPKALTYDEKAPFVAKTYSKGGNLFYDGGDSNANAQYLAYNPLHLDTHADNVFLDVRKPLDEVVVTPTTPEQIAKMARDYLTMSNDATLNANLGREQNIHLKDKTLDGAKAHAAWEQDNPDVATAGLALGAAPFAVATAPAWIPMGDALASSSLGTGLTTLATNPYIDAAGVSMGLTDAAHKLYNGQYGKSLTEDAMTALELTPLGYGIGKGVGKAMDLGEKFFGMVKDRYGFVQMPNSFTRGIGGDKGLEDLVESGVIRGSRGTETTAKGFSKAVRNNREQIWTSSFKEKHPGIENRYYRRELTEDDFNAIKEENKKYSQDAVSEKQNHVTAALRRPEALKQYNSYDDYLQQVKENEGYGVTHDENWTEDPMAYFYDDGRNPLTAGHDYAASDYGIRINNASAYNPYIHSAHQHFTTQGPVSFMDPNVSLYKKGLLGTIRLNKETLRPQWMEDLRTVSGINAADKAMHSERMRQAIYRNVKPYSYSFLKVATEVPFVLKDYLSSKPLDVSVQTVLPWQKGFWMTNRNTLYPDKSMGARRQAWAKYLSQPQDFEFPIYKTVGYDKKGMEIVEVNPENVEKANGLSPISNAEQWMRIANSAKLTPSKKGDLRYHDYVTENHGGLEPPQFNINNGSIRLQDTWDLQPLQKYSFLPKFLQDYEFGKIVGGKPFRWDQTFLYKDFH